VSGETDPGPAGDEPDDRALLAAHLDGDPAAFGTLFTRHRDRLWAVALRTTGDPEEAADALQDALVAAFRRAESYRGDAAVTTWLHRIVVNACLDRLRRRKVRAAEPLPDDLGGRQPLRSARGTPPTPEDPADTAERHDRRRAVLAALARLSAEQRAALVLVDMEGYSMEEAADVLGVAVGTVKSRCSRGRARLLPMLAELREPGRTTGNRPLDPRVPSTPPGTRPDDPPGTGSTAPTARTDHPRG
jgi:RNA polymerase sigma-70 factor (ECF subfamily)